MKKNITLITLALVSFSAISQVIVDTVAVGAGYANQKWYSLQNDEQGTTQGKDNWDIAFEITGYSSAILANTQKPNFALYHAPYAIGQYGTIDTLGMHQNWKVLYNSDSTWTIGAFNKGLNPNNPNDLGWGVYDVNTHFVTGDSCYVIKVATGVYKKLKIVNLANGVYNFEYANINGTSSQTQTIAKSNYTGKNFVYFDIATNAVVDREPVSANWDLTFGRYTAMLTGTVVTPYPVVGVLTNKGVKVAQADNVVNVATYNNFPTHTFSTNISVLGYDWKTFDLGSNSWKIVADTCYFVKDKPGNMWKVIFKGFGGSTNGNTIFSKEKLSPTGITEANGNTLAQMVLYPNPSNGGDVNLVLSTEQINVTAVVKIMDLNGKLVKQMELNSNNNSLNVYSLDTQNLENGIYIVNLTIGNATTNQKLVINN